MHGCGLYIMYIILHIYNLRNFLVISYGYIIKQFCSGCMHCMLCLLDRMHVSSPRGLRVCFSVSHSHSAVQVSSELAVMRPYNT